MRVWGCFWWVECVCVEECWGDMPGTFVGGDRFVRMVLEGKLEVWGECWAMRG